MCYLLADTDLGAGQGASNRLYLRLDDRNQDGSEIQVLEVGKSRPRADAMYAGIALLHQIVFDFIGAKSDLYDFDKLASVGGLSAVSTNGGSLHSKQEDQVSYIEPDSYGDTEKGSMHGGGLGSAGGFRPWDDQDQDQDRIVSPASKKKPNNSRMTKNGKLKGSVSWNNQLSALPQLNVGNTQLFTPKKSNSQDSLVNVASRGGGWSPPARLKSSSGTPDDDSSESSICEDYDYNSSADEYNPNWERRGLQGRGASEDGHMIRSSSFGALNQYSASRMTRAQSHHNFGQWMESGCDLTPLERGERREGFGSMPNMRKVRSHHQALSDIAQEGEDSNSNHRLRRLQAEVRALAWQVKDEQKSSLGVGVGGPFSTMCWYLAMATNLLLAGKVFSSKFLAYVKNDLKFRTVTARVVSSYVRRATNNNMPSVLNRRGARGKTKHVKPVTVFSAMYSGYNRDGVKAAGWASPFVVFAFLIFKQHFYNVQGWAVVASCFYSWTIPIMTNTSSITALSRLNIATNALYLLTRYYRLISQFEAIKL